jgi:hypothetical protein
MTIHENEIYIVSGGELLRTAPGFASPVWSRAGVVAGPPAIYGNSVVAVTDPPSSRGLHLTSFDRGSGDEVDRVALGFGGAGAGDLVDITLGGEQILVRTPWRIPTADGGSVSDAFVTYSVANDRVAGLACAGYLNFRVKAAVYNGGLVTCERDYEWLWWSGNRGLVIAQRSHSPDLFKDLVPPTVLGNIVYFGTWAADIQTNEILWRLPLEKVLFGVVPADRLLLVVDGKGNLHAFKSRVGS